jgi:hypothetical protein
MRLFRILLVTSMLIIILTSMIGPCRAEESKSLVPVVFQAQGEGKIEITFPAPHTYQKLRAPILICGTVSDPEFESYSVYYMTTAIVGPVKTLIAGPIYDQIGNGILAAWDIRDVPGGQYYLIIEVTRQSGEIVTIEEMPVVNVMPWRDMPASAAEAENRVRDARKRLGWALEDLEMQLERLKAQMPDWAVDPYVLNLEANIELIWHHLAKEGLDIPVTGSIGMSDIVSGVFLAEAAWYAFWLNVETGATLFQILQVKWIQEEIRDAGRLVAYYNYVGTESVPGPVPVEPEPELEEAEPLLPSDFRLVYDFRTDRYDGDTLLQADYCIRQMTYRVVRRVPITENVVEVELRYDLLGGQPDCVVQPPERAFVDLTTGKLVQVVTDEESGRIHAQPDYSSEKLVALNYGTVLEIDAGQDLVLDEQGLRWIPVIHGEVKGWTPEFMLVGGSEDGYEQLNYNWTNFLGALPGMECVRSYQREYQIDDEWRGRRNETTTYDCQTGIRTRTEGVEFFINSAGEQHSIHNRYSITLVDSSIGGVEPW